MDKNNEIVGKCKYCVDPIYRFQVEAHRHCIKEFEFNPDYLDFKKGVEAGKQIASHRVMRTLQEDVEEQIKDPEYRRLCQKEWDKATLLVNRTLHSRFRWFWELYYRRKGGKKWH